VYFVVDPVLDGAAVFAATVVHEVEAIVVVGDVHVVHLTLQKESDHQNADYGYQVGQRLDGFVVFESSGFDAQRLGHCASQST